MNARKYAASQGEPDSFDFDGSLRDRKLTPPQARAMYDALRDRVPELAAGGPIAIKFGYRRGVHRRGSYITRWDRYTGAPVSRSINLNVHSDGATEKTLLHELAHACGGRWDGHGPKFSARCLRLQEIWLEILTAPKCQVSDIAPLSYSIAADTEAK